MQQQIWTAPAVGSHFLLMVPKFHIVKPSALQISIRVLEVIGTRESFLVQLLRSLLATENENPSRSSQARSEMGKRMTTLRTGATLGRVCSMR